MTELPSNHGDASIMPIDCPATCTVALLAFIVRPKFVPAIHTFIPGDKSVPP
jgi:hypothetical protein